MTTFDTITPSAAELTSAGSPSSDPLDSVTSPLTGAKISLAAFTDSTTAAAVEFDITRNMRAEVNIYTYRTPSYMLSTAQDWRKGFGGDQSSIWQATIGSREAVAFTTHPGAERTEGSTPRYWVGYGTLPRAAQVRNMDPWYAAFHVQPGQKFYLGPDARVRVW